MQAGNVGEQGRTLPRAINLPLSQLRARFDELAQDRELWICCAAGQRAYFAARFLTQRGYRARNLSGGYTTYKALRAAHLVPWISSRLWESRPNERQDSRTRSRGPRCA